MPVVKYRSLEEAGRALWLPTGDPRLTKRLRGLWQAAWVMAGRFVPPRGVRKFANIAEANAEREEWEKARVELIRKTRKLKSNSP